MFIHILREEINKALTNLGAPEINFNLEHPVINEHGDFATNVAMVASKALGKNPRVLAEEIVAELEKLNIDNISRIEIAGPGFINFFVADKLFHDEIAKIDDNYGKSVLWNHKRILVEHSSPNLFKPFHIGHLMNNAVGESIVRLAQYSSADVIRMSYPSDVSLGIAKAIYIVLRNGLDKIDTLSTEKEKLAYLGECYAEGTRLYDEDESAQKRVKEITEELFERKGEETMAAYEKCKDINLEYFVEITKRLGSTFDTYIFESETGKIGEQIVRSNIGKIYKESDGAVIYEGEQDGLHTRVFINKEGRPTYEAKDTGLLSLKFERYNPDLSIFVTDNEQAPYFEVVSSAAGKINKDWKEKTIHRTHGRMTFKGQKMSSRLGGVPLAADIVDTLTEEVGERAPQLTGGDIDDVAIGAIKFVILRAAAGKNINFDPDTSLSFEGDSGPYLQYTAVRAGSVLQKALAEGIEIKAGIVKETPANLVEKTLARFPEVVINSINDWAPHYIATYLLELAQAYNSWYGNTKMIDRDNPNMSHNLAITQSVQKVITRGLWLLGVDCPNKM